jgi:non-ribosomal peptide synthetase component F
MRSYIIQSTDVTLHHTSVTFDAHLEEILGTAMMGGELILLSPDGHLDIEVIAKTISRHEVTYMFGVPSQMNELIAFSQNINQEGHLRTIHRIASGGKIWCHNVLLVYNFAFFL